MNTSDILKKLAYDSINRMTPDELRENIIWESKRVDKLAKERDALRVENLKLLKIVNRKNTEMAELRAKYDDIMETYQNVIDEKCASDERHCTCVPFLRMEIKRLRAAIDKNINNALTIANYIGDGLDYGDAPIVTEMAHNIVNELGKALGEVAE